MNNKNELIEKNKKNIVKAGNNKPGQVVKEALEAARELQKIVDSRKKKLILGGKQYLYFEDWQTLGRFDRTTAKVIDTKEIFQDNKLFGFSAKAVALKDGIEISAAEAECCFDEPNWKNKPRFQLKSMAQTRACAKALRNCLAFVAVLANYEPTPAEEMIANHTPQTHTSKSDTDLATQSQINLIKKQIISSHLLAKDELKRINEYLETGMTKQKASEIIGWWLGNKEKGIEGVRSKREKKEKASKAKENKETEKDKLIEEINSLRHENFLDNDEKFYRDLKLNKKLEEHTEKELKEIIDKLKEYVPDYEVLDEEVADEDLPAD